jgi:transposase
VRTERDLLKEQLNHFKRQLFTAKSEASTLHKKDMFFDEAKVLGEKAQPAAEEAEGGHIEVPAHKRGKRGRKPLDPALPREFVRHEVPEGAKANACARTTAPRCVRSASRSASNWTSSRSRFE